jgi:7-cyano-7-deazaguanine synthase
LKDKLAITLLSGGLDSTTLAYMLNADHKLHCLIFDYGQRHRVEIGYALKSALHLGAKFDIIDMVSVGRLLGNNALTGTAEVPEGHYEDATMKSTVVPNRNMMMLSIAYAVAAAEQADVVAYAAHAGDHAIYPDCTMDFAAKCAKAQHEGLRGVAKLGLNLFTPFITMSKHHIIKVGEKYRVPFGNTWSCYKGGDRHCGKCGTCVERREAFALAKVNDPTTYEVFPNG